MHLVEVVDPNNTLDMDQMELVVYKDIIAICSCKPSANPDSTPVYLYSNKYCNELREGEHYLEAPEAAVTLKNTSILYSSFSLEDWVNQFRDCLGVPQVSRPRMDEEKSRILACHMEEIAHH